MRRVQPAAATGAVMKARVSTSQALVMRSRQRLGVHDELVAGFEREDATQLNCAHVSHLHRSQTMNVEWLVHVVVP